MAFSIIKKARPDAAISPGLFAKALRASKARDFIEHRLEVPLHNFAGDSTYLSVGSKKVWAAFRACHITANTVLSTTFKLAGTTPGRGGQTVDVGSFRDILATPNPGDSWEDLLYLWTFHTKLTGKAYWLKDEMDGKGRPKHIYPLFPQYMQVVPHPTEKISKYVYKVNGREVEYDPEEIIHFRRPHPADPLKAIGDVEAGEALFSQHIDRDTYREKVFEQGAIPSGILVRKEDPGSQDQWDELKAGFKAAYGGKKNVGKTAFMSGEWTYIRMGMTGADMEELEHSKLTVSQIFNLMGVPLSLAGVEKAANYATARQDEINFRKYEIVPLLDMLVGRLNMEGSFTKQFNPAWELAYELSGLVDVEQIMKDWLPLVKHGGMTLNEARVKAGLEPVNNPLLDQFFMDSTRVPIELAGIAEPAPEPAEPRE